MQIAESNSESKPTLNVNYLTPVPQTNIDGFTALLKTLLDNNVVEIPELLAAIWIVPHGKIQEYVNIIIKEVAPDALPYKSGLYAPLGLAIPVENKGVAVSFILIDEKLLENLTPDAYLEIPTLSTILEEILHVKLYTLAWKTNGYVHHSRERFGCKAELLTLCARFHDEYAAVRLKTQILANQFSVQDEDNKLIPVDISYGEPIHPLIDGTFNQLRETVVGAASSQIPIAEAWPNFSEQLYRGIFEPLARSAGFMDARPNANHPNHNPENSPFYAEISPFWEQIRSQLTQSFESNFLETEMKLHEIAKTVDSFMQLLGVHYQELDDGQCWVDFDTTYFDELT